jgi:uncharacterized membrane protein (DUF106 family)
MERLAHAFNSFITRAFDLLFLALMVTGPFWALMIFSMAAGLIMLWIFGKVSNQERIGELKTKIQANLIGVRLFQNSVSVFLKLQGRILRDTLVYMKYSVKPMLVMIIPFFIILIQLHGRYGIRPLDVDQAALVKVQVADPGLLDGSVEVNLEGSEGVHVETPAVRIPSLREVAWRVRPDREGEHLLIVRVGTETVEKRLVVGKAKMLLSSARTGTGFLNAILHPGERPLGGGGAVEMVSIAYPAPDLRVLGWGVNWLAAFLVVSIAFGYLLKGYFGIHV